MGRRSTRGFLKKPVPKEVIKEVIETKAHLHIYRDDIPLYINVKNTYIVEQQMTTTAEQQNTWPYLLRLPAWIVSLIYFLILLVNLQLDTINKPILKETAYAAWLAITLYWPFMVAEVLEKLNHRPQKKFVKFLFTFAAGGYLIAGGFSFGPINHPSNTGLNVETIYEFPYFWLVLVPYIIGTGLVSGKIVQAEGPWLINSPKIENLRTVLLYIAFMFLGLGIFWIKKRLIALNYNDT